MENNTMDALTKIENFVKKRYDMAVNSDDMEERWIICYQAFGAMDFFAEEHPELEEQAADLWENHYYSKFEELLF